ncbi:MAG: putative nucleic acid-binding Zn-ribbon protein, partial [Crocinitomicaceae bacterium]
MNRETNSCAECGSSYFKDGSLMAEICPECSHRLYGHTNCEHVFENGRCKL